MHKKAAVAMPVYLGLAGREMMQAVIGGLALMAVIAAILGNQLLSHHDRKKDSMERAKGQ